MRCSGVLGRASSERAALNDPNTRLLSLCLAPSFGGMMQPLPLGFNTEKQERVVLKVGDEAPGFTLTNAESAQIRLSDYGGKENVILLFGRAHW